MTVEIKEITESEIDAFVDFPYALFKGHPFWVGELRKDTKHLLELGHPFWRHGERKLFMAWREGKPLGRVAAIINSKHNSFHNEKCGFFGFFDCVDDTMAASGLLEAAVRWVKSKGMDTIRGPMNPSTNETCGMLLEGFDSPPAVMMPYNPPYYLTLLESAGFVKAKDLLAFKKIAAEGVPERLQKIIKRITRAGNIKIDFVDISQIDKALAEVKEVYNAAWNENWGFVPMTNEELDEMAQALKPLLKPEYLYFIRVMGKPAGFVLLLPDLNIPLKGTGGVLNPLTIFPFLYKMFFSMKSGRLLALGVKKEFRGRGLELLLIEQSIKSALKRGWEYGDLSWTLEDNELINSVILAVGAKVYKKFRVYEKAI